MFKFLSVLITLMFFVTSAHADYPKDTLHVERIIVYQNGTGTGQNISGYSFTKRYYTALECDAAAATYNLQKELPFRYSLPLPVYTVAKCEAINHSTIQ